MINYITILSPLDQFEIRNLFSIDTPLLADINLSITNIGLYMVIACIISFYYSILATYHMKITQNKGSRNVYLGLSLAAIIAFFGLQLAIAFILLQLFRDLSYYGVKIRWEIFCRKYYISDPMLIPGLSVNCLFSGFHTGKGKGKAVDNPEQDNPCSSPESDKRSRSNEKGQEDEEQQLLRAIQLSLEKENKEESPKTGYTGKGKRKRWEEDEEQQLLRAIQLSLEKENKGESPKTGYTGKGKGRAVDNPEQDNPCSSVDEVTKELDLFYHKRLQEAKELSLKQFKAGESSKSGSYGNNPLSKQDPYKKSVSPSPQQDLYDDAGYLVKAWKKNRDLFRDNAKQHNILKTELAKRETTQQQTQMLEQYRKKANLLAMEKTELEKKLSILGINPQEQYLYDDSSSDSENTSKKRFKNFGHPLFITPFRFNWILGLQLPSWLFTITFFFVISFLFSLDLSFIMIQLSQLVFIALIVHNIKLIYKGYSVLTRLWIDYVNKEYMTLYFNLYFTIVLLLLEFSSNCDISIFYI